MTLPRNDAGGKIQWQGVLLSVQPRIRLTRSFDQRSHAYLGYALKVSGRIGSEAREFLVGVGQGAHTKHHFRAGYAVSGDALPVPDARLETVEFYKVSNLKVGLPEPEDEATPPPWRGAPPPLVLGSCLIISTAFLRGAVEIRIFRNAGLLARFQQRLGNFPVVRLV